MIYKFKCPICFNNNELKRGYREPFSTSVACAKCKLKIEVNTNRNELKIADVFNFDCKKIR